MFNVHMSPMASIRAPFNQTDDASTYTVRSRTYQSYLFVCFMRDFVEKFPWNRGTFLKVIFSRGGAQIVIRAYPFAARCHWASLFMAWWQFRALTFLFDSLRNTVISRVCKLPRFHLISFPLSSGVVNLFETPLSFIPPHGLPLWIIRWIPYSLSRTGMRVTWGITGIDLVWFLPAMAWLSVCNEPKSICRCGNDAFLVWG